MSAQPLRRTAVKVGKPIRNGLWSVVQRQAEMTWAISGWWEAKQWGLLGFGCMGGSRGRGEGCRVLDDAQC